jgi:D-3-phosphoglycerate dehydrogenase
MATAAGLSVQIYDPYAASQASDTMRYVTWDEVLATSDFVSIHCPLNAETRRMFNAAAFARMKPSATLINTSRGGIVDTPALVDALRDGHIGNAAIDVLEREPPLPGDIPSDLAKLVVTPHAAWYSEEALADLQRLAARAIVEICQTGTTTTIVNRPTPS